MCYRIPPLSWLSLELLSWWQASVLWFGQDIFYLGYAIREIETSYTWYGDAGYDDRLARCVQHSF